MTEMQCSLTAFGMSYSNCKAQFWPSLQLSPPFFGPFQVIQHIGQVASWICLLDSHTYYVHVSYLKPKLGKHVTPPHYPHCHLVGKGGEICSKTDAILQRRMRKQGNRVATEVLVKSLKWQGTHDEDATWSSSTLRNNNILTLWGRWLEGERVDS